MTSPMAPDEAARVRALARLLDSALKIPGTGVTIGLDSIIGLVPGIGDLAGGVMSGYIVLVSARLGVPPAVVSRMILNLVIDTFVGSVPIIGDLFDVGYRANLRNAALLDDHLADPKRTRRSSFLAIGAAVGGVVLLLALGIAVAMLLARGLNYLVR